MKKLQGVSEVVNINFMHSNSWQLLMKHSEAWIVEIISLFYKKKYT